MAAERSGPKNYFHDTGGVGDPEVVKLRLECPECGYQTLVWSEPSDEVCPECDPRDGEPSDLTAISGVGARKAAVLWDAGYHSISDIREATQTELAELDTIGNALAARIMADVGNGDSLTDAPDTRKIMDGLGIEPRVPELIVSRVWLADGTPYDPR